MQYELLHAGNVVAIVAKSDLEAIEVANGYILSAHIREATLRYRGPLPGLVRRWLQPGATQEFESH